jgi:hypothetical protein
MDKKTKEFLTDIIEPTLKDMGMYTPQAADFLLQTARHESGDFAHRVQQGGGPGRGRYQIEVGTRPGKDKDGKPTEIPRTALDHKQWLGYPQNKELRDKVFKYYDPNMTFDENVERNDEFGTAMAISYLLRQGVKGYPDVGNRFAQTHRWLMSWNKTRDDPDTPNNEMLDRLRSFYYHNTGGRDYDKDSIKYGPKPRLKPQPK